MDFHTKSCLKELAEKLKNGLRSDARTRDLGTTKGLIVKETHTGGHSAAIAELTPEIHLELWLDLYSGLDSPRVWVGFYSTSKGRMSRLLKVAEKAGIGEAIIYRSTRHAHERGGAWKFRSPLKKFDDQFSETYGSNRYLGLYLPQPWPFSAKHKRAIVRDSLNYVAALTIPYRTMTVSKGKSVGPWNRPDKLAEAAAVKHIKARLKKAGYTVISRETVVCGYDLHAVRDGSELHVEVKGVSGSTLRFFLTKREFEASTSDPDWRLAIVLEARTRPRSMSFVKGGVLGKRFKMDAIQWHCTQRAKGKEQGTERSLEL